MCTMIESLVKEPDFTYQPSNPPTSSHPPTRLLLGQRQCGAMLTPGGGRQHSKEDEFLALASDSQLCYFLICALGWGTSPLQASASSSVKWG